MSNFTLDFVVSLKKVQHIINEFKGPKVHTIYEVTIAWTINYNTGHPYWVEIPNSLYVPNRHK